MLDNFFKPNYYCAFVLLAIKKGASRGKNSSIQAQSNTKFLPIYLARVKRLIIIFLLSMMAFFSYRGIHYLLDIPVGDVLFVGSTPPDEQTEGAAEDDLYLMMFESLQANYWDVNLSALQHLLEEHNWVRKATLRRQWPDELLVGIDQHVPVARWNNSQLLSVNGVLFDVEDIQAFKHLPHFISLETKVYRSQEIRPTVALFNRLQKTLKTQRQSIVEMTLSVNHNLSLKLDSGMLIELGKTQHLHRLQRLITFVDQNWIKNWSDVAVADLRYGNGLSIRWVENTDFKNTKVIAIRGAFK